MKNILRAAAFALSLATVGASAQTFNPEIRISNNVGPSIMPVVAAVGTNVYIAWVENESTGSCTDGGVGFCGNIWFSRSLDNGVTFSPAVNLTPGTTTRNDRLPVIAAGGTQVHVFWTDSVANQANLSTIRSRRSTDSGANFAAEVDMTPVDNFYSRPTSALVDAAGNTHLVWYDSKDTGGAFGQIFYRCSTAASQGAVYSAPVNVTQFDGAADQEAPRLAQGTDGTLYLVMRSTKFGHPFGGFPPNEQIMHRSASAPPGCPATFLHPAQKITPGMPTEMNNTFGAIPTAGAGNVLHLGYWSDKAGTNLYYRRGLPIGAGWGTVQDLSGFGPNHLQWDGTASEMGGFGLGDDGTRVYAVFGENNHVKEGFLVGNLHFRCSPDGGQTWVPRTLASSSPEITQPRAVYNNNRFHMVYMDWRDNNTGAEIYYRNVTTGACVATPNNVTVSTPTLAFGGQSMGTTSPAQSVTLTNTSGGTATINGIGVSSAQFAQTNNCGGSLGAGLQCTVTVTFTPAPAAGAVNSTTNVVATLNISTTQGNPTVNLTGTGEKSLITHFYRAILQRAPDAGGFNFWFAEPPRTQALGMNVNEVWYAMAMFFYNGPEYASLARNNTGFVTDLYKTFFNRDPDAGGLNFWVNELNSGVPREVVLASFMFSTEFANFAQAIFGNTAARAEVDMVGDFFRGLLARLPDDSGFNFWVTQFRQAQCQGQAAVYTQVESISSAFVNSGEYVGRARNNSQFVGDLYNAFLRRGGDLAGVNFWISALNGGATRSSVRNSFTQTPEFQTRVNAVVAAGCLP